MTDTAVARLRTGERIPLSEPLDEARRLLRDQQYDSDVIGIEMDSGEAGGVQTPAMETTRTQTAESR